MNRTVIIIPTYNERDNITSIVSRVLNSTDSGVDVLVVDDNSPDGTGFIARGMAEEIEQVHFLHREQKQGLGVAYLSGFAWALERGYDRIFEMDADGSHPAAQLPRMIEVLDTYDIVIGSRWVQGGRTENWPLSRELLSRSANLYARSLLGLQVRDATGGFRGFTATALRSLDLAHVASSGYCFQVDLIWRGLQAGLRVREVPITFTDRVHGDSKMSLDIALEGFRQVTGWGLQRLGRRLLPQRAPGA